MEQVITGGTRWSIEMGEALVLLAGLPSGLVDAVITDPPYSSGGMFRGDRTKGTGEKYVQHGVQVDRPDFVGDTRDQRAYGYWTALWLSECWRICAPGAPIVLFSDWRQLSTTTDSLQAGGFVYRGCAIWDKTEGARPTLGGFRSQVEFLPWGTKGAMDEERCLQVGALPGVFRHVVRQDDKFHQTGKPTPLMMDVVKICRPGGLVLDPFAGSGTTVVAALASGRRGIGFEATEEYSTIARQRCAAAVIGGDWRLPQQGALFGNHGGGAVRRPGFSSAGRMGS